MQLVSKGEPLTIDESSLTGESLPVTRHTGDTVLSGAVITAGEGDALVTATGKNSFFGKTIALLGDDDGRGHMQKVHNTACCCMQCPGASIVIRAFSWASSLVAHTYMNRYEPKDNCGPDSAWAEGVCRAGNT